MPRKRTWIKRKELARDDDDPSCESAEKRLRLELSEACTTTAVEFSKLAEDLRRLSSSTHKRSCCPEIMSLYRQQNNFSSVLNLARQLDVVSGLKRCIEHGRAYFYLYTEALPDGLAPEDVYARPTRVVPTSAVEVYFDRLGSAGAWVGELTPTGDVRITTRKHWFQPHALLAARTDMILILRQIEQEQAPVAPGLSASTLLEVFNREQDILLDTPLGPAVQARVRSAMIYLKDLLLLQRRVQSKDVFEACLPISTVRSLVCEYAGKDPFTD